MKRLLTILLIGSTSAFAAETGSSRGDWAKYEILIERNVFSRARHSPRPESARAPTAAPPAESYVVLKGVVQVDDGFVAFMEDVRGGTKTVSAGDELAGGTVKRIHLDGLVFSKDGKTREVEIGGRLGERTGAAPLPATAGARPSAPTAAGSKGAASVLEMLRLRRQKELGKN